MQDVSSEIKYPVGIQSFSHLREDGYLYVDKTANIYPLIEKGGFYFLSRPRRFGKSLLLSTLEAYYLGQRDLFKGLALDSLTDDWDPHPVLHLDLNYGNYLEEKGVEEILDNHLHQWEEIYGKTGNNNQSPSVRFNNVIRKAYEKTGKKVVILIDEYDKPLLNAIGRLDLADLYRSQLKAFYSNLKTMDRYIEMAMLTGVARFSKVSIFSDLNNLRDISFETGFAAICGITSDELDRYFQAGIQKIASAKGIDHDEARELLRRNYDGYHFAAGAPDIYNPFSLVNAFAKGEIGQFWFDSGTPSYLVKLLHRNFLRYQDISPTEIDRNELESAGLLSENPVPVFYQSGYLTIRSYDPEYDTYILDYPNEEVKQGFLKFLMRTSIPDYNSLKGFSIPDFVRAVRRGDPEDFMRRMESLIAGVPYAEKGSAEAHFQNAVYLLFTLVGFYARTEERTSDGRIDLKVETDRFIYIFEFKINSSSETAMEQIEQKRYWLPDAVGGKEIFLIGANFDTSTHRLDPPVIRRIGD